MTGVNIFAIVVSLMPEYGDTIEFFNSSDTIWRAAKGDPNMQQRLVHLGTEMVMWAEGTSRKSLNQVIDEGMEIVSAYKRED